MPGGLFKNRTRRAVAALPDRAHVGSRLRAVRKEQGLTLKLLSARSGVPVSTLSKVELGQVSVSYEKFLAVASALDVDIAALFDACASNAKAATGHKRVVVVRSTPDAVPRYDGDNYQYRMLATAFPGKRMTPVHGVIVARQLAQFPDYIRHEGQELVVVLSGRVRIHFETGEVVDLTRHESAYFDSGTGHVYLSTGKGQAQVLVVMTQR